MAFQFHYIFVINVMCVQDNAFRLIEHGSFRGIGFDGTQFCWTDSLMLGFMNIFHFEKYNWMEKNET